MYQKLLNIPVIDKQKYQWIMFGCWLNVYRKYSVESLKQYIQPKARTYHKSEGTMKITAGLDFTKNNIRIVFTNQRFELLESLKEINTACKFRYLISYIIEKYEPNNVRLILERSHLKSQAVPRILLDCGYEFGIIPTTVYEDPFFNLLMAVPQKSHFYKAFLKAAMLWIPAWKAKLITVKQEKNDDRQLTLF